MRVLCLDTALADCQAAVVEWGASLAVLGASCAPSEGDAEAIVEHAAAAIAQACVAPGDIARVVVTVGPGSFTGVRVALSFAKGWGVARDVPVLGISTLEALARTFGGPAIAAVDARHGAVYAAQFNADGSVSRFGKWPADDVRVWAERDGLPVVGPASAVAAVGLGEVVARIDMARICEVAGDDPAARPPTARYIAGVDALPQRHKSLARA